VRWLAPVLSERRRRRIEQVISSRLFSVTVVLENLHDPHNGAAVLRSCEAMGLLHVHVVEGVEPFRYSRKVSQNAHKWLNVYHHRSVEECLLFLKGAGFVCWAAVPPPVGATDPDEYQAQVERPLALVYGNEHQGLSSCALALCQQRFSIPMQGFSQSLNLSVSVAVGLSHAVTRRREHLGRAGDLSREAKSRLRAACYAQSTRHGPDLVLRGLGTFGRESARRTGHWPR
jgi:tRNA (guanosine-2'-O-)-methyltransferase